MLTRDDCLVPDWPAPPGVEALVTTRRGGCSEEAYASLNLGTRVGDRPECVAANRAALARLLPEPPRWLAQVHGSAVVDAADVQDPPAADAAWTAARGVVCAIQVADCLPVLFATLAGDRVAAAHAGWRGLAAGVLENTVSAMTSDPAELVAWLGPAIGPEKFEVGPEVREAFLSRHGDAALAFHPGRPGKWYADLFLLARQRLEAAGVTRVHGGGLCTASDPQRFFSHRRDGTSGRMAALVWRT